MSDSVLSFPNILQPTITLKTYAPMGIKYWENQEAALDGMKEFADGWFARRHQGAHAAIEAAKRIGEAATPIDVFREYQDWLKGAMDRLVEDGTAFQRHALKGTPLAAPVATPEQRRDDQQRAG